MTPVAVQNRIMLRKLLVIVAVMLGFAYALVPMYRKICEVVGISATRDVNFAAASPRIDQSRRVTVEFVATANQSAPLSFEAIDKQISVHPGEVATIRYRVVNTTGRVLVAQAVPSFGPQRAAKYFTKLECFCFSQQTLQPGEAREMPVVFYVNRDLPTGLDTITLGYTFFDAGKRT